MISTPRKSTGGHWLIPAALTHWCDQHISGQNASARREHTLRGTDIHGSWRWGNLLRRGMGYHGPRGACNSSTAVVMLDVEGSSWTKDREHKATSLKKTRFPFSSGRDLVVDYERPHACPRVLTPHVLLRHEECTRLFTYVALGGRILKASAMFITLSILAICHTYRIVG